MERRKPDRKPRPVPEHVAKFQARIRQIYEVHGMDGVQFAYFVSSQGVPRALELVKYAAVANMEASGCPFIRDNARAWREKMNRYIDELFKINDDLSDRHADYHKRAENPECN
jgi:hypothetical protein